VVCEGMMIVEKASISCDAFLNAFNEWIRVAV